MEGIERQQVVTPVRLLEIAKASSHFPVLPDRTVVWQALQDGTRENRWVLYLRGPNLAIGSQELAEWPGTPRFDESTEFWTYQAALDRGIYPRQVIDIVSIPLTPQNLFTQCWTGGVPQIDTEEIERRARDIWKDLSRPRLEGVLQEGLRDGAWAVLKKGPDETFYTREDLPLPAVGVASSWVLIDPASALINDLNNLRPGRGPQPVTHAGTPREVLVRIWEELGSFHDLRVSEISITAVDRDTLDNTLVATWADRPESAQTHVSLRAAGEREMQGKTETVNLDYEGRFEEVRSMLSPLWPFQRQGDLDIRINVRIAFDPPVGLGDGSLETYRTALMNANQGSLEIRLVPARTPRLRG